MKKIKPENRQRGFTLVELMIALILLSYLGSTLYEALHTTMRGTRIVDRSFRVPKNALMLSKLFEKEFTGIYLPEKNYVPKTSDSKTKKTFFKQSMVFGLIGKEREINFTTLIRLEEYDPAENQEEEDSFTVKKTNYVHPGDILEVGYKFEKSDKLLVKRVDPIPDEKLEKGGLETEFDFGIEEIKFEYFDKKWESKWDSTKKKKLPRAIKATFKLVDKNVREILDKKELEKTAMEHVVMVLLPNAVDNRKSM